MHAACYHSKKNTSSFLIIFYTHHRKGVYVSHIEILFGKRYYCSMRRLLLVDGNAMLHRAFHAIPLLTNAEGKPTNAIYGFATMLIRLVHDLQPTHIAVVFDRPAPTFRKKLAPTYQETRPKMDEGLASQIPAVHKLVSAFHIPIFEMDGFEADDLMGTIVTQVTTHMGETYPIDQVIIVTGDRDILQLVVDENVLVYMPTKGISEGKLYDEQAVIERLGIHPTKIADWKGFAGDQSDNYPGVFGIGPKTAVDLVATYGSVEAVYEALEKGKAPLSQGVMQKLTTGKESALLSKNLATIRRDVPIQFVADDARLVTLITDDAIAFLEQYRMGSIVKRLKSMQGSVEKIEKEIDTKEIIKEDSSEQLGLL